MYLKKLEISNVLGVQSASMSFEGSASVFIIQCVPDCPIRATFATAVELIVSKKYARMEALTPLQDIHRGFVRLTFVRPRERTAFTMDKEYEILDQPTTSKQAAEILKRQMARKHVEIVALRDFRSEALNIEYSIDNGIKHLGEPNVFHGKFCTDVEYVFPYLCKIYETQSGNLLSCVLKTLKIDWYQDQKVFKLVKNSKYKQNNFLEKISKALLETAIARNVLQKTQVMKVCADIRRIFEFITCDDYSVWFFIPYQGKYSEIDNITVDELDLDAIETCIQLKNDNISRLISWKDLDQGFKDLLLIALDIALAFVCKKKFIFIRQTDASLKHKNILQRIVDVCNYLKKTAIIEYAGGIHLQPVNANIVKCVQVKVATESKWDMKVLDLNAFNIDKSQQGLI